MNYEQMYKETRRWIESIYPELSHEKQMLAEKLFPELKESKDILEDAILDGNEDGLIAETIKYKKEAKQKPVWSEEDERLCQCLIEDQEEALDTVRNDKYGHSEIISDLKEMYHERIDWLKSLRTRNTWKPSDEQMAILWHYADQNDYDGAVLTSLYNNLKKLKEK